MGEFFRDLVLGITILIGISSPAQPPVPSYRVFRDSDSVYISIYARDTAGEEVLELIHAGTALRISGEILGNNFGKVEFFQEISFDPFQSEYLIIKNSGAEVHRTKDLEAALLLWERFASIEVAEFNAFEVKGNYNLKVSLFLEIPDESHYDPMVLWNYQKAEFSYSFTQLTEIPF
jgi:hypothetical protein